MCFTLSLIQRIAESHPQISHPNPSHSLQVSPVTYDKLMAPAHDVPDVSCHSNSHSESAWHWELSF